MVAIGAPIFQGISFCRCRPLHGGCIDCIGGSSWVGEGHVQEGLTMWRRKLDFDVCPRASTARGSCANLVVARRYSVAASGAGGHTAECILPVVVSAASAATQLLACHGMIDVAALLVLTTVAGRGWDAGVVACAPKRN